MVHKVHSANWPLFTKKQRTRDKNTVIQKVNIPNAIGRGDTTLLPYGKILKMTKHSTPLPLAQLSKSLDTQLIKAGRGLVSPALISDTILKTTLKVELLKAYKQPILILALFFTFNKVLEYL